jgi:galactokinase/mevalonate kinase-like predicted kinase
MLTFLWKSKKLLQKALSNETLDIAFRALFTIGAWKGNVRLCQIVFVSNELVRLI